MYIISLRKVRPLVASRRWHERNVGEINRRRYAQKRGQYHLPFREWYERSEHRRRHRAPMHEMPSRTYFSGKYGGISRGASAGA